MPHKTHATLKAFLLTALLGVPLVSFANPIAPDCTFEGKPLYGTVRIVDSFPDVRVKVVESFADLHVKNTSFPTQCGEWKVTDFPDPNALRVQFVENFPDIRIKFVDFFPGRQ